VSRFLARLLNDSSRPDPEEEKDVDEKLLEVVVLRLAIFGGEALTSMPVMEAVRFLVDRVRLLSVLDVIVLAGGFALSPSELSFGWTFSSRYLAADAAVLAPAVELTSTD
jgi:hypothetical protein